MGKTVYRHSGVMRDDLVQRIRDDWPLDIREAAAYMGVEKNTIYRWLKHSKFPGHILGSRGDYRFYPSEMKHWVKTHRNETMAE